MTVTNESMEEIIAKAIRDAAPTEEECLANEEECLKKHPIHPAGWTGETLVSIYADIDGLADIIAMTLIADYGYARPER